MARRMRKQSRYDSDKSLILVYNETYSPRRWTKSGITKYCDLRGNDGERRGSQPAAAGRVSCHVPLKNWSLRSNCGFTLRYIFSPTLCAFSGASRDFKSWFRSGVCPRTRVRILIPRTSHQRSPMLPFFYTTFLTVDLNHEGESSQGGRQIGTSC